MQIKRNAIGSGIGLLIICTLVGGCQTSKDERSDGRLLDDRHITADVKKSLKREPAYKFDDVNVDTFAGVVQLSGFVNNDAQRSRAEEIARNTPGTKAVSNGLALKPTNLEPTGRTNVNQRIYAEPLNPTFEPVPGRPVNPTNPAPTAPQPK